MNFQKPIEVIKDLVVQEFNFMGKFYENLDDLISLIKKLEKKNVLAEFIIRAITIAKSNPHLSVHEIIKQTKETIQ